MNKLQGAVLPLVIGTALAIGCTVPITHSLSSESAPASTVGTVGTLASTQPTEDSPEWECRTMGNRACGVEIGGTWYVVQFDANRTPISVRQGRQ